MTTVKQLIEFLERHDPNMPVAFQRYSENEALDLKQIKVEELCIPRADGWVANARPDKLTRPYLVFPGN